MTEDSVITSITNAQAAGCERCSECPIQGKHCFVKSSKDGPSRRVCSSCYHYYLAKRNRKSTVAFSASNMMVQPPSTSKNTLMSSRKRNEDVIKQNVNKAQRGEFDVEGRKVVKAVSTHKPHPTNVPAAVKVPFPEHLRSRLGGHSGYSAAHDMYNECHQFYHDRAMSAGNMELVTLSATMAFPQSGKFKVVGDITAIIPNVNVRVGYHDLHSILYIYLLPLWLKYSRNTNLLMSTTTLCNHLHAKMLSKVPDVDAIKDMCYEFRGRNRTKTLVQNKHIKLFLHISSELVSEADFRRAQYSEDNAPEMSSIMTHTHVEKPVTRKRRAAKAIVISDDEEEPPSKRLKRSLPSVPRTDSEVPNTLTPISIPLPSASVDRATIRQALVQQGIRHNTSDVVMSAVVYRLPDYSWADLLENPNRPQDLRRFFQGEEVTITYNSKQKVHEGSFKMALTECTTSKVVFGDSTKVCLKRCFDRSASGEKAMYCEDKQYTELSRELNCILWAKIMLELVYKFVDNADKASGTPPSFGVPQLRFVDAGLVVVMKDQREEVYMMEELIPKEEGWLFYKYICNNSAVPLLVNEESSFCASEKNRCARFLSFAQHVQYIETASLAFTSDFQGGEHLLTDPQIITDPSLGSQLFARGNVAFDALLTGHSCKNNEFCQFYKPSREGFRSPLAILSLLND